MLGFTLDGKGGEIDWIRVCVLDGELLTNTVGFAVVPAPPFPGPPSKWNWDVFGYSWLVRNRIS